MSRRHPTLYLLFLALIGCGGGGQRVTLAEYDFLRLGRDEIYGFRIGRDVGLHRFGDGWERPKGQGLWATGPAELELEARGEAAMLRVLLDCPRSLAARAQRMEIQWNDRRIHGFEVAARGQADTLLIEIPASALRSGLNRVSFQPSLPAGNEQGAFRLLRLELSARLTPPQQAAWEELLARPAADPRWSRTRAAAGKSASIATEDRPDVLVLLLDTLRADHLSCYGYARETSPFLDGLAAEGAQLDQVFADAPYTVCSIPSFFTGHSWREHGVHHKDDALAPEFTTLAELFQASGYATWAISDNPNVSVSHGSDQGFDRFVESWNHPDKRGDFSWRPEFVETLFEAELPGLPADRPVFYYVHIMPPHSPYQPGAEHDVFSDPNYAGPVDGSVFQIRDFDEGKFDSRGADLERLISLYDGGIRRGDAIARRVRERFVSLGRRRELVTVILSDHGEGFGEHGRFGHNSTPNDEMLRVPAILHPARRFAGLRQSRDAMRSLGDLNALLVHYLDLSIPPESLWPRAYLRVLEDPHATREQLFIRCERPYYGLRTRNSLTTLELWGEHGFYDLGGDPLAQENLRASDPESYLAGLGELRAFLENSGDGPDAVASELSEEERERLRSLGY